MTKYRGAHRAGPAPVPAPPADHPAAPTAPPAPAGGELPAVLSPLQHVRARGRIRGVTALLGPAFVASVAYVDPGNFATNFQGGAQFGYTLAWVILLANLMAMLVQYLSAKLGVVTGMNLAELCRAHLGRRWSVGCGCRPRSSRWPLTWRSSSAPPSH